MKDFDEFKGPASAKGLITAVTDTLDTSHLTQLNTTAQHEDFLQQQAPASLKRVLLFTDKAASTVLARGLSWAYERRLLFGEVRPSVGEGKAIAERYGVDKYPTIVIVKVSVCVWGGGSHRVWWWSDGWLAVWLWLGCAGVGLG